MTLPIVILCVAGEVNFLKATGSDGRGVNLVTLHALPLDGLIRTTPIMDVQPGVSRGFEILSSSLGSTSRGSVLSCVHEGHAL